MTLIELLALLAIAGACGALGQTLAGTSRGGCLMAIVLGFIGALIGQWLARRLELPAVLVVTIDGQAFPVIWSIAGAALFAGVVSFLGRRRR